MWIKGLTWLTEDTLQAATPLQIERWLRKQFYSVDRNREDRISAKDLKNMLSQVNYRVPNMRFLRERLTDLEQRSGDITYGQFAQLYRSLMYSAQKTVHEPFAHPCPCPNSSTSSPSPAALPWGFWVPLLQPPPHLQESVS